MNDASYPTLGAAITKCVDGPLNLFHVHFEPASALASILNAPVTSLAQITKLKPGKTGDDLKADMDVLTTAQGVKGCHGAAWGKKVEHDVEFDRVLLKDMRSIQTIPSIVHASINKIIIHPYL